MNYREAEGKWGDDGVFLIPHGPCLAAESPAPSPCAQGRSGVGFFPPTSSQ